MLLKKIAPAAGASDRGKNVFRGKAVGGPGGPLGPPGKDIFIWWNFHIVVFFYRNCNTQWNPSSDRSFKKRSQFVKSWGRFGFSLVDFGGLGLSRSVRGSTGASRNSPDPPRVTKRSALGSHERGWGGRRSKLASLIWRWAEGAVMKSKCALMLSMVEFLFKMIPSNRLLCSLSSSAVQH